MTFFLDPGVKEENKVFCLQKGHNLLQVKERWYCVHRKSWKTLTETNRRKKEKKKKQNKNTMAYKK